MIRALRAAAVVAAACGLSAGCGTSNDAAARRPAASLTIVYRANGSSSQQRVWTLACGPPGGTHPRPASVMVAPCIWLVHRRPDLYPEPEAFRPERWLGRTPGTYEWLPFGGGRRRCLGGTFATFELEVVLRTLLRRADLRAPDPRPEGMRRRAIVFAPGRGAQAVLESRAPRRRAPAAAV